MYSTRKILFCLKSYRDATHFSQYGNIPYHNDDDLDLNEFVVKLYAYIEDKSIACALFVCNLSIILFEIENKTIEVV